jgi:hypothetical protein
MSSTGIGVELDRHERRGAFGIELGPRVGVRPAIGLLVAERAPPPARGHAEQVRA